MGKSWAEHAAPYVRKAMKTAMAQAKKTWKGKKELTPARRKQVKSLQQRRSEINAKIKKLRHGG